MWKTQVQIMYNRQRTDEPLAAAPSIVVDIDDTICYRLPRWLRCIGWFWICRPMPGAADVLGHLHRRYGITYVTARNRYRTRETKWWLRRNGFPVDNVPFRFRTHLWQNYRSFKQQAIRGLQKAGAPLRLGIGDRRSDAEAYQSCGLHVILMTDHQCGTVPVHRAKGWHEIPDLVEALFNAKVNACEGD